MSVFSVKLALSLLCSCTVSDQLIVALQWRENYMMLLGCVYVSVCLCSLCIFLRDMRKRMWCFLLKCFVYFWLLVVWLVVSTTAFHYLHAMHISSVAMNLLNIIICLRSNLGNGLHVIQRLSAAMKEVNDEKVRLTGIMKSLEETLAQRDTEINDLKSEASHLKLFATVHGGSHHMTLSPAVHTTAYSISGWCCSSLTCSCASMIPDFQNLSPQGSSRKSVKTDECLEDNYLRTVLCYIV